LLLDGGAGMKRLKGGEEGKRGRQMEVGWEGGWGIGMRREKERGRREDQEFRGETI
jgi:hypothetical protein